MLINLLSHAIKYNHDGGEVRVAVAHANTNRIRLAVQDTGPGIDGDSLERLFVPFQRLDVTAGGVEGTGLGLALSRVFVDAMGGSIGVTSEVGEGSRFWVELARGEPVAVESGPADADPIVAPGTYPGERRLLYIEDTVANVRLIEAGDAKARAPLIEAFLPHIASMARVYRFSSQIDWVEPLQEGVVRIAACAGALRARAGGSLFWGYATWWVRQDQGRPSCARAGPRPRADPTTAGHRDLAEQ